MEEPGRLQSRGSLESDTTEQLHFHFSLSCTGEGHFRAKAAAAADKSLQSCPTLGVPTDSRPPGSAIPGILQARTLEGLPFPSPMHESEK